MNRKGWHILGLYALSLLPLKVAPVGAQNLPPQIIHYPEMVLVNGKVLTADDKFTVAEAIAIRDGRFLAVGSNALIRQMIGPQTQVTDVQGRTVIPGFINSHLHLADYAERPLHWWRSPQEALETVKERVATTSPDRWIVLWYSPSIRHIVGGKIQRQELDVIAPKHAVVIGAQTGGGYMLNSIALERLAGFQAGSKEGIMTDPQTGEPTGQVEGLAARTLGVQVGWLYPIPEKIARLKAEIDTKVPLRITTIHTRVNPDGITSLRELWAAKELKPRWRVAFTGFRGVEHIFLFLGNLTGLGDDMVRITGIAPGSTDGNVGTGDAWTFDRKQNLAPNKAGDLPFGSTGESWARSRDQLMAAVKFGWSIVGVHSDGDRGTAEAIADYKKARATRIVPSKDQVLRLDHLSVLRDDEIQKMKELGMVPSVAPWHVFSRVSNVVHMYGLEKVGRMARGRSLLDEGLKVASEVSFACPFWNTQFVVSRKVPESTPDPARRVYGVPERVTREEALKMHTNYPAWYFNEQDRLGTVDVGKLADLVFVDGDYMTIPEDKIETLAVQKTILGGKVVYETDNPQPCLSDRMALTSEMSTF